MSSGYVTDEDFVQLYVSGTSFIKVKIPNMSMSIRFF